MRGWLTLAMLSITGSAAAAQSAPTADPASAAVAARVETRSISHPGAPPVTVRVPRGAVYAGGERFTLYGVADCEIHVFVEADAQRRIRRFYWIQFESYLPSRPELRYNYAEGNRRMELWGAAAWVRAGAGRSDRPARAGSDTERVRAILQRAGYTAPPSLLTVRMVRMLDDPEGTGRGRNELMLIYAEDMGSTGLTPEEVMANGAPNERWAPLEGPLIARATAAFEVVAR